MNNNISDQASSVSAHHQKRGGVISTINEAEDAIGTFNEMLPSKRLSTAKLRVMSFSNSISQYGREGGGADM